ncbi:MAG: LD-carboxypeptidase [Myxococcota bacterium]
MESPKIRLPRPAPPGAVIGVCAPAGPVHEPELHEGLAWLEEAGYRVRCGEHLRTRRGYLAGTDEERLSDLLALVRAPEVDAILLARGGYGVGRLLRRLDAEEFRAARKVVIGYSDATLLQTFLLQCAGLASIHGPMFDRSDTTEAARERLLALLRGETEGTPLKGQPLKPGCARGRLVGGNLSVVLASLGTPWEIDTRGAILFFEERGEALYRIDRMLVQLRDAGKLADVAGVAFGKLVGCETERYPEPVAAEVVREVVLPEVSGPVLVDLPFGHVADNHALGVGIEAELDGNSGSLALLGPVVEDTA